MEFESSQATSDQIELENTIQLLLKYKHNDDEEEDPRLLAKLLSQLESVKADGVAKPTEASADEEIEATTMGTQTKTSSQNEIIVEELKKLEKQNRITHWLLSALILLTAAWQLSEVSILFQLKHGFSQPFKAFQGLFEGMFKRREDGEQLTVMEAGAENRVKFARDVQTLIMGDDQD